MRLAIAIDLWAGECSHSDVIKRRSISLCAVALSLFLTGCGKKADVELPAPVVTVTKAVEREVRDWDEYTGRLEAVGSVEVRPRVSGYITEVKFTDGDLVKKGQPLFIIDPRPYQAAYDKAKGDYDKAESAMKLAAVEFQRAAQLREKGVTSAGDFDQRSAANQQATGAMSSARSAMEEARLDLEFCTVIAPIDGLASRANITVGNLVSADSKTPLTSIVSTNPVYAYADVDERSLLRYVRFYQSMGKRSEDVDQVKTPIQLSLQDEADFPHTGVIDFVDNQVDSSTGTIRIRGVFDYENGLLTPGLFVRVKIPAGNPYSAVMVPERAVAAGQGQKYVYVVSPDNEATLHPVTTGAVHDGWQVIKSGGKAGDTVVVDGVLKVRVGEKVDPKPAADAEPPVTSAPSPTPAASPK